MNGVSDAEVGRQLFKFPSLRSVADDDELSRGDGLPNLFGAR
jgi:hypothetical protein